MNSLDFMIGNLSEETAHGITRRGLLKMLFATGSAIIVASLGLEATKASSAPDANCSSGFLCSVPCDSRAFCLQKAVHYNVTDCSDNNELCPTAYCGANKLCKQSCKRCCQPNQCSCGSWTVTKSCIFCGDEGSDQCLGCSGNCPSSPSQPPKP